MAITYDDLFGGTRYDYTDHLDYTGLMSCFSRPATIASLSTEKKVPPMKKSEVLRSSLAAALAEEARLVEKFGEEPEDDEAVLFWRVRFTKGGTRYSYAAIRANGLWYTTGPKSPKGYTWEELTAWLDTSYKVTKFQRI